MRWRSLILAGGMLVAAMLGAAAADPAQWTASKVRGGVQHLVSGAWTTLSRGEVVADGDTLRTLAGGFAELTRGEEVVSLSPGTLIQLHDKPGKQYTTIGESSGQVTVMADVRNVVHFEVDTPYLAAVVKGTVFTVTTRKGRSSVAVDRGKVQVVDGHTHQRVLAEAGQTVTTQGAAGLGVSGSVNRTNSIPGEDSGLSGVPASTLQNTSVGVTVSGGDGNIGAGVNANVGGLAHAGVNANLGGGSGGTQVGANVNVGGNGNSGGVGVSAGVGNGGIDASVHVGGLGLHLHL